jgi:hypothetical protein
MMQLTDDERNALRKRIEESGEVRAARALGIAPQTLIKAAGGFAVHRLTASTLRGALGGSGLGGHGP